MKTIKLLFLLIVLGISTLKIQIAFGQEGTTVNFPKVSEPIQIVDNGKEHLYASYYGINSFSRNDKYATVLETDIRHRLPTEDDPAILGLVNLETLEFTPLAETRAWNFQQGCMAHWLGTSPDSLIIFNDLRDGKFVSVIMNVHTQKELRTIPFPISAVSLDGHKAASLNFTRIRNTRVGYGYGGKGQQTNLENPFPEDEGLYIIDLQTGNADLIVTIADVKEIVPKLPENGIEYFNHTLFSRGGSKIFWLARAIPNRNTTALTVNVDGSRLTRCFPEGWGGSHFDWLDDDQLMVTAEYKSKKYGHILFTPGRDDYKRMGGGLLDYDGHGTFSQDKKWLVTDTYPQSELREQKIYLMDMTTHGVLPLGRYYEPKEFTGRWRCDIHCRWSSSGRLIGFNSTHSGSRQAYMIRISN